MLGHEFNASATTSSGSAAITVKSPLNYGILKHIFIKAATSSTTFDISLTDKYSNITTNYDDNTGVLTESTEIMSYGDWTLTISNASVDEAFTIHLTFLE